MKKLAFILCLSMVLVVWVLQSNANITAHSVAQSLNVSTLWPQPEVKNKFELDESSNIRVKSYIYGLNNTQVNVESEINLKNNDLQRKSSNQLLSVTQGENRQSKIVNLDTLYPGNNSFKEKLLDQAQFPEKYISKASSPGRTALSSTSQANEDKASNELSAFDFKVVEFNPGLNGDGEPIMQPLAWPYIYSAVSGPPDFSLYENTKQKEKILSLGHRGSIVIKVVGGYIFDGQGDDFKIFENPFVTSDQNVYAETALVSVAQKNKPEEYVYFNCQSSVPPFKNCAGVGPVFYQSGADLNDVGGDAFDLADLGIDKIQYIKIEDTGDNQAYFIGDEGFDLDSMAIIHGERF